ncbi:MAG: hypothetical protein FWK04_12790 [Nostoc sp. GBBB01]|nr:hypothetical protein [Nostoc sp. GBBB01]
MCLLCILLACKLLSAQYGLGKGERGKGKGERGKGKGERGKGKGFKYILYPLPLSLFPDHKGSSYCLSEPYWL